MNNKKLQKLKSKLNLVIWLALSSFILSACSGIKEPTKNIELDPNSKEFIETMFIQQSNEAVDAQQQYMMLVADNREQKQDKQNSLNTDTIDIVGYIGKPTTLLKAIANKYGYDYNEVGAIKNLPTINLDIKKQTPIEVLTNISYQVDKYADLVLDKDNKVIRLIYRTR
jgi:defect in organelle trafficking protein DotD